MLTILPHPNFACSAIVLADADLVAQRSDCSIILRELRGSGGGWASHPAVTMWRDYDRALQLLSDVCLREWVRRGHPVHPTEVPRNLPLESIAMPPWLGDDLLHSSHRGLLLKRRWGHYAPLEWTDTPVTTALFPKDLTND